MRRPFEPLIPSLRALFAAHLPLWACVGLVSFTAACASTPIVIQTDVEWVSELQIGAEPPASLAFGFSAPSHGPIHRFPPLIAGDTLVYEIGIQGDGGEILRFLAIEVGDFYLVDGKRQSRFFTFTSSNSAGTKHFSTPIHEVALSLYDEHGALIEESSVLLAEGVAQDHTKACLLYAGLSDDAWESKSELRKPLPKGFEEEVTDATTFSLQSLTALLGLTQDDELLSKLLWNVIKKPSIVSVVLGMSVNITIMPGFHLANPVPSPFTDVALDGPFWNLPMAIAINGETALDVNLLVANFGPPYSITGGILAFEGHHPDGSTTVQARLVGARIGSAGAAR